MNTLKRKLGNFRIPNDLIHKDPAICFTILSTVIPVKAEYMYDTDSIKYVGISHSFDEVPLGQLIPTYKAVVIDQMVRWEKQD